MLFVKLAVLLVDFSVLFVELAVLVDESDEFLAFAALLVVDGDLTSVVCHRDCFMINLIHATRTLYSYDVTGSKILLIFDWLT